MTLKMRDRTIGDLGTDELRDYCIALYGAKLELLRFGKDDMVFFKDIEYELETAMEELKERSR